ncbi:phage tail tape measure protein [Atlantibacter hermannii]|uniref:phage tail tape measure protein n=1 Tax=Atlantibacter hermannii TaxID=565 RepID=UPI0030762C2E
MAIVNELITKFGFIGNLAPQETFNANLKASIGLLAAMGAAIAGSAAGIAGWVASVSDTVDPMVQFSRETGVAIETIQTLGYAASVNGSSVDALQSSLAEMTKRVGEFVSTGEGEAKDVAGRLGLKFRDLNGHVKSSDVIFRDLADKLHGMSQAEKFSVLDKMGIDRSMVQLLSMTGEEISSLQSQAEALGIVTQEQADQFAAYNDSLTTLGKGFEGIKFQVAVGFVPVLKELVDGFTNFLIVNKDLIKDGLSHLGEIIFSVMGMIRRLMPIVAVATTGFIAWKIAAIGLRTVLATIFSPVVLITAAIVAIILVIDDLLTAMEGGQSVIADFFSDNWGIDIVPALNAAKAALMAFIDYAINVFKPLADAIASMFKMVWHLITGAFTGDFQDAMNDAQNVFDSLVAFITGAFGVVGDAIKYVFGDAGEFIVSVFTTAIENTKLMFFALWKLVAGDFKGAWKDVLKIFDNSIELMKKPFNAFIDWAKNLFAGLGDYIGNVINNAASNAWNATKSFFGLGDDEQQQGVTGGGNGGMSPDGIPYGMNAAVSLGGGSQSYSPSYSFNQQNYVTAPNATAAGDAIYDRTQQQQQEARRMYLRGMP